MGKKNFKKQKEDKKECEHLNTTTTYSSMFDWCYDCDDYVLKPEIRKK